MHEQKFYKVQEKFYNGQIFPSLNTHKMEDQRIVKIKGKPTRKIAHLNCG